MFVVTCPISGNMEPPPNRHKSNGRGALNPWQALGKGSDVSLSVCHPRSLPPEVAVQPRTGPPAHLLGLGTAWAGAAASGSCTLAAASPACWVPCSCCWPSSQGPLPAGCLVCRGQDAPLCSHFCAFLSRFNLSSILAGGIGVGGWWVLLCHPFPHSLGSPTSLKSTAAT